MIDRTHAPCGHDWRASSITRTYRFLFPTMFFDCHCSEYKATWTERYEFDFSVPLGGATFEQIERMCHDDSNKD